MAAAQAAERLPSPDERLRLAGRLRVRRQLHEVPQYLSYLTPGCVPRNPGRYRPGPLQPVEQARCTRPAWRWRHGSDRCSRTECPMRSSRSPPGLGYADTLSRPDYHREQLGPGDVGLGREGRRRLALESGRAAFATAMKIVRIDAGQVVAAAVDKGWICILPIVFRNRQLPRLPQSSWRSACAGPDCPDGRCRRDTRR